MSSLNDLVANLGYRQVLDMIANMAEKDSIHDSVPGNYKVYQDFAQAIRDAAPHLDRLEV